MYKQLVSLLFLLTAHCALGQPNIGQRTFKFKDESRNRPLITEVWYPTVDTLKPSDKILSPFARQYTVRNATLPAKKLPLILLSHGTGGGRLTLEWLAQALAQSGFIVAAVDHWGNTYDNKIPIEFVKPWERPMDISFVLTALLKDNAFKNAIDQHKVGAIGFSFGGYTVIALAGGVLDYNALINFYKTIGHKEVETPEMPGSARFLDDPELLAAIKRIPPLKDNRIKAFFSISPGLGGGFVKATQFADIDRPVYIVGSQSDSMAPVKTNAMQYHQLIAGSGYYEFPGKTGHYVMLGEAIDDVKKEAPQIFTDAPSVNRHEVHLKVDSLATDFFRQKLK